MTKANLRSRISNSFELPDLPQAILHQIIEKTADNYYLSYDDADTDNILFELIRDDETIIISGHIRRWQGTQSQIQLDGRVNLPARVSLLRKFIFGLVVGIPGIYGFWTFIVPWILIAIDPSSIVTGNSTRVVALTSIIFLSIFLIFIMSFIVYLAKNILLRDSNVNKRWQAQQELDRQMRGLQSLTDNMREIDTSRLRDDDISIQRAIPEQLAGKSAQN